MKELEKYLNEQKSIVISTKDWDNIWSTNIFYWYENKRIYFISPMNEKHSQEILTNSFVSFANNWFNPLDFSDRKWIQWIWNCYLAESDIDIEKWVELHNLHFPQFKERITFDYIKSEDNLASVWYIDIDYIKYWDDELYWNWWTKDFNIIKKED